MDDEQLDLGVITQGGSALPENHRDLVKQDLKYVCGGEAVCGVLCGMWGFET